MRNFLNLIHRVVSNGFNIETVYDIGACNGSWSKLVKDECLPNSTYYLFEANSHYLSDLIVTGNKFFINVLSSADKQFVEFYPGCNTGDSYYKETTTWYDNITPVNLPCTTLDAIIEMNNLPIPNLLKIDTQGSELDILSASTSVLGKTEIILCEMPIIEYNMGAPQIYEYLSFFKNYDYIPVEIAQVHKAEDTLLQIDFVFMTRSAKEKYLSSYNTIRV